MLPFRVASVLLLALLSALPAPTAGQSVSGVVVDEATGEPIEGAMILLVDYDGVTVDRVLTDAAGRFQADAGRPGPHTVRVERIGFAARTTEPFPVPPDGTFQEVSLSVRPVVLRGLDVAGDRRCEVRPEEGRATALVWEEARKALAAAAWTLDSELYRYTLLNVTRLLDRAGDEVVDEVRDFRRGRGNAPYVSLPAERLVAEGFVQNAGEEGTLYYAPDASAFLSDPFLDTHCMRLARRDDGALGLEFEPVRGRDVTDIAGVLWVDEETARLRRLEFRYVNLARQRLAGAAGGWVSFSRVPSGAWIVREWAIRMPVLDYVGPSRRRRVERVGYRDEGGVVWRVTDRDGSVVLEVGTATVGGSVTDSSGTAPARGARVRTLDGDVSAEVGEDGGFLLPGLAGGLVALVVEHPALDTLGLRGPATRVDVPAGEIGSVRLRAASVDEALAAACSLTPVAESAGILYGVVRTPEGAPAAGAAVRVTWLGTEPIVPSARAGLPDPERPGPRWSVERGDGRSHLDTTLDDRGSFLLCGVPRGSRVQVSAHLPGSAARVETVDMPTERRSFVTTLSLGR